MPKPTARLRDNATLIAVFLLAATASLLMLSSLLEHTARRYDLTATRAHRLGERSQRIVDTMPPGAWELVLATRLTALDPRDANDITDVLGVFAANSAVDRTVIDTGSASGSQRYTELLSRLAQRDAPAIAAQTETIESALSALATVAEQAGPLSAALTAVGETIPPIDDAAEANARFFADRAAAARVLASDLLAVDAAVRPMLTPETAQPVAGTVRVARVDLAADALAQPLEATAQQLSSLAEQLARFASVPSFDEEARARARDLIEPVRTLATDASAAQLRTERLERPDLLKVATALGSGDALLVIGPPGVTAIDTRALFPDRVVLDRLGLAGADVRRRAEELIATAIGSLSRTDPPIVVFAHGETQRFIDQQPVFRNLQSRLALRGIDTLEWATAIEPSPPSTASIDPLGVRPVVYATLAPDAGAGSPMINGVADQNLSGPARMRRYADAINAVIESGAPVLLSLNPSPMPGFGEPDPQNELLALFGLQADTGSPLLAPLSTPDAPDRRLANPDLPVIPTPTPDEPAPELARAISGLRMTTPWAVAIERTGSAGAATPLVSIDNDNLWAETQWQQLWRTPRANRALLSAQPAYDASRDTRPGACDLAWAVEVDTGVSMARMVAVGSNAWHIDPITTQAAEVDGRVSQVNPGSTELFEASVYWLAGQEELIARSARAGSAPRIKPISSELLGPLRLLLALGPAMGVIGLGLLVRIVRG